jgi:serine/threonine protein kinase
MSDEEINLIKKMLDMNPYTRITAREAIEHDWFDKLRAKDPEYSGIKNDKI